MPLLDLLSEFLAVDLEECWERERTATPVMAFAACLHATGCLLRGSVEILRELHVHPVIPRYEGPPEVTDSPLY